MAKIADLLKDKPPDEKSIIKARALADINIPLTFTHNNYTVKLLGQPREKNGLLEVWIDYVIKDGIKFYVNNPFLYKNPPIMIPDETFHKKINKFGIEQDVANFVEDIETSFKEIVTETLRVVIK